MTIAKRLVIHGRVQGVWFRAWTVKAAYALGVTGWVRNLSDGTVEAHVEGSPEAVEALIVKCHKGPPLAQVSRIDQELASPLNRTGFNQRHD
ncbi:MAG: acylphosphatase [Geminicoccaceae bacterium]